MLGVFGFPALCHGFFTWQPSVVKCVHVDNFFCFHNNRGLWLVFQSTLTLQRHPQLLYHGTTEGPLQKEREEQERKKKNSCKKLLTAMSRSRFTVLAQPCQSLLCLSLKLKTSCCLYNTHHIIIKITYQIVMTQCKNHLASTIIFLAGTDSGCICYI